MANGSKWEAAQAVHRHCGVSLLRAHRVAWGLTLVEVTELLKANLRAQGSPSEGLAHQRVSRWENGLDTPTPHYLDALCYLYQTRPDRLGFGKDYSIDERDRHASAYSVDLPKTRNRRSAPAVRELREQGEGDLVLRRQFLTSAAAAGLVVSNPYAARQYLGYEAGAASSAEAITSTTVTLLEENTESCGYALFSEPPADFIPARIAAFADAQRLLLRGQNLQIQKRLNRVIAKNAGFVAIRLMDVAGVNESPDWFRIARRAARRADDVGIESWIVGHWADAHSAFSHLLKYGLELARTAQSLGGRNPNSAAVFGLLVEAGVHARLGRHRETLEAVRHAEQAFSALPDNNAIEDGIRTPEYFLRLYQADALTLVGEKRLAESYCERALELPLSEKDLVGRASISLYKASLLLDSGQLDDGCNVIMQTWADLPREFHSGVTLPRTVQILDGLRDSDVSAREVRTLREYLRSIGSSS
jgi:transcriptional regulator with XRE-family HTH domain